MITFSDKRLLELNHSGLIPGPLETAEEFSNRADYCLNLKDQLSEEFKDHLGTLEDQAIKSLNTGFNLARSNYDIVPHWIPIFFSNYKLPPWHGGCAWIFQMTDRSPVAALLQLRSALKQSVTYLGIYSRDELVAHELAHVGRMKFEEPKFEEILAYRSSSSAFRRWFGGLIQSSTESMLFMLTLVLIFFIDVFLIFSNHSSTYFSAMWLKTIPLGMLAFAGSRLWIRQRHLNRCLKNLTQCTQNLDKASNILYRLTDKEIIDFSKMEIENIRTYAAEEASKSLRWQLINKAYF